MMLSTPTTTADQVLRADICKAYEFAENLTDHSEFGYTWRVRQGATVRLECYLRRYVHYQPSADAPFSRREELLDINELTNNTALAYLKRNTIDSNRESLRWELETAFPYHRALKLETLKEVLSQ